MRAPDSKRTATRETGGRQVHAGDACLEHERLSPSSDAAAVSEELALRRRRQRPDVRIHEDVPAQTRTRAQLATSIEELTRACCCRVVRERECCQQRRVCCEVPR
jgi:hypothetical protein